MDLVELYYINGYGNLRSVKKYLLLINMGQCDDENLSVDLILVVDYSNDLVLVS